MCILKKINIVIILHFWFKSRVISRYSRKEMSSLWSDEAKWSHWLEIEILVCEAWVKEGKIPPAAVKKIRSKARIDGARIDALEKETRHDVIAFVSAVGETVGPESRYLHFGLTSSDVLDTALACQLVAATSLLEKGLKELLQTLKALALKYKKTPMMGRTHGIHAEPITFGLKVSTWYAELTRQFERLNQAKETIAVGKLAGAVGTYVHVPTSIEETVLNKLGLKPETAPTQVVSRDRHAFYFGVLAGIAGSIEKIAVEIRHLSRTEVQELAEPFGKGQKGSSAMPHKRNPILTENLTGLARLVRAYAGAAFENVALWHERDISHSSVERVVAPDATIALDFMIYRLLEVLKNLEVYPEKMKQNMEATRGVVFSQEVLLALVEAGLKREQAYKIVQTNALNALKEGSSFKTCIAKDAVVKKHLKPKDLDLIFNWQRKLQSIDKIIERTLK